MLLAVYFFRLTYLWSQAAAEKSVHGLLCSHWNAQVHFTANGAKRYNDLIPDPHSGTGRSLQSTSANVLLVGSDDRYFYILGLPRHCEGKSGMVYYVDKRDVNLIKTLVPLVNRGG